MDSKNIKRVGAFVAVTNFTEPQIRWWISQAPVNGLAKHKAVFRIGKRVYVDVAAFERWIDSQATPPEAP